MDLKDRLSAALAGRYEIECEIGRGGMAMVYLARDLKLSRRVAIKVLRPEFTASLIADRFVQEIQIAARLEHPLILALYESDSSDGLLWYAMPYIKGETLYDRLKAEKQLPVDEAVRITCEVAEALSYAHGQGVVHRDIKPANILFSDGHPLVADFGIAKAFTEAGGPTHTATAVGIGTPGYMSPEQATGEKNIDPRTDIYSLACVLYEMLAGETPYTGPTAQAIIAKQLSLPVPSVCTVRDTVPPALDDALCKALAKVPADRFVTVSEFALAVRSGAAAPIPTPPEPVTLIALLRRVLRQPLSIAGGAAVVVGLVWVVVDRAAGSADAVMPPDTSRYAILPFEYGSGVDAPLNETQLLHDALSRWSGLSVADPFQVREVLAQAEPKPLTQDAASGVARQLGAGRYLRGSVSRIGDSLRVQAGLYDVAANGAKLADYAVRLARNGTEADSAFVLLVDRLLFRGSLPADAPAFSGTRSLPARQAFVGGQRALETWKLSQADSAFSVAAGADPAYAQAHLWLALVRAWAGVESARWRVSAEQAMLGRRKLSSRDRVVADAVVAQARGDIARACPLWQRVTQLHPHDFAAWYGSAHCQANDSAVVPDPGSPSLWRFRTSYHRALLAYQRAFELLPSILGSLRGRSHESLRRLLFTTGNARRRGYALPPDTARFVADPAWDGDSLAFVPFPRERARTQLLTRPAARDEAIRRQRLLFRDITLTWMAAFPRSAAAIEAAAIALAELNDPSALDTLRRARELADDQDEQLSVAGTDVWMRLAFGLPSRVEHVQRARSLADSLLEAYPPTSVGDPLLLAGFAALTGRAGLAGAYMREEVVAAAFRVPVGLQSMALPLLMHAALGGPVDSLVILERRVRNAIDEFLLPVERDAARFLWLGRSAVLAFSAHRFEILPALTGRGAYLLDSQVALAQGDSVAALRGLTEVRRIRLQLSPAHVTFDVLYPEAELFVALGEPRAAAEWLDPTLNTLPQAALHILSSPERAASLVRAMALRARLAHQLGEPEVATKWARAVTMLWDKADPFLQPIVRQMRDLSR